MGSFTCNTFIHPHSQHASSGIFAQNTQFPLLVLSIFPKPMSLCSQKIHSQSTQVIASPVNVVDSEKGVGEKPKFRWVEINPHSITEEQKLSIFTLPKKMTKRCKAFLNQIICFSPEKGSLSELVVAWTRVMKPKRADWLIVLKELRTINHPLFIEVSELALLEETFEANVRDYTKLIHIYATQNRLRDAESTLLAMENRGMSCDQVTLTTLIHMYSKAGNFQLAEEIIEKMKLLNQPIDKRSYGSMITNYIRAGTPSKGEELLKEMENLEIYPGREVYKALLRAYSMIGDADGSQRIFDAIQIAGIIPDVKTCGLLINAYFVAGRSREALIAFENMRRFGVAPNDKCVSLVLSSYEKEDKLNEALEFLIKLERDAILIGKESSEILVRWFRKLGVVEEVADVLRDYTANEEVADVLRDCTANEVVPCPVLRT